MKTKAQFMLLTLLVLQTQACALMFKEPTLDMPIITKPVNASVVIKDEKGIEVYKGISPQVVKLKKSDGTYGGGKYYLVTISKAGYKTKIIPVVSYPNNVYVFANVFIPYLGWLVDPFFGNMYDMDPQLINVELHTK